jgi:deaminated glutathione amidase
VQENIDTLDKLVREAQQSGALMMFTPEMVSLLDRTPGALNHKAETEEKDKALAHFKSLSRELEIFLSIGSLPIKIGDDKYANRSFFISPTGEVIAKYDTHV